MRSRKVQIAFTFNTHVEYWIPMAATLSLLPASADFLLGLLFDPKDGCDMFLQSIGLPLNYIVLHRTLQSSQSLL